MTTTNEYPSVDLDTVPEQHRARVEALIPDERIAKAYVHRDIEGVPDFDVLDVAMFERENVMLEGPTGSSKTTLFRAYCAARRLPFALVECQQSMDLTTVIGRTDINADGLPVFVPGDMLLVAMFGGVILYDEGNMAPPRISAGMHGLLSVMGRMSVPEASMTVIRGKHGTGDPQPTLIGCAYNAGYQGTARLNEAFQNRFAIQMKWDYERSVEEQLCSSTTLLDFADGVRSMAEIRTPVSTNALMEYERHFALFGQPLAARLLVNRFRPEEQGAVHRAHEANSEKIAADLEAAAAA